MGISKSNKGKTFLAKAVALSMMVGTIAPMNATAVFAAANDVNGHWAAQTITGWQEKGLVKGYEDGSFKPDNTITRAEFVRFMNQALGLKTAGTVNFSDVSQSDWFYGDVAIAMGEKYTAGFPDGTFKPNDTITRAQAAAFITGAQGLTGGDASKFSDAATIPSWATTAVGAVVEKGYMSGYPDGSFKPNAAMTRAEAVSTLDRAMGNAAVEKEEEVKPEVAVPGVVIEKNDGKLEDQTIEGNVTVSEKVGNGQAYLKNLTITGDLIVNGGGGSSVYVENVVVEGKTIVNKAGVRLQLAGKTELPTVEINEACTLVERGLTGSVGTIAITDSISDKTTIAVPANALNVNSRANLVIAADIATVVVGTDAKDTKIEIESAAVVAKLTADSRCAISGLGKVQSMDVNANGVTISNDTRVISTNVADGYDTPTKSDSGSSSGGGSSNSDSTRPVLSIAVNPATLTLAADTAKTLKVDFTPVNSTVKTIKWYTSNTSVATVSADGLVTGVSAGTVTITATSVNGKTADCVVTVTGTGGSGGGETPDADEAAAIAKLKADIVAANSATQAVTVNLIGKISTNTEITYSGTANLTIDLQGYSLGDLKITAGAGAGDIAFTNTVPEPVVKGGVVKAAARVATPATTPTTIGKLTIDAPDSAITTTAEVNVTTADIKDAESVAVAGAVGTMTINKVADTSTTVSGDGAIGTIKAEKEVKIEATKVTNVTANAAVTIDASGATIASVAVTKPGVTLTVTAGTITTLNAGAKGVTVAAATGSTITTLNANAENLTVKDAGTVTTLNAITTGVIIDTTANAVKDVVVTAGTITFAKAPTGNITVPAGKTDVVISVKTGITVDNLTTASPITVAGAGTVTAIEVNTTNNITIKMEDTAKITTVTVPNNSSGDSTVTIDNKTTGSPEPTVVKVVSIATSGTVSKTHKVGDIMDLSGLTITATLSSGGPTTGIAITPAMVEGFDSSNAKTLSLTFTYAGVKTTTPLALEIGKATPVKGDDITATAIQKGQTLASSKLSGTYKAPVTGAIVPGTLDWNAPTTASGDRPTLANMVYTFTPNNPDNFEIVATDTIDVVVVDRAALDAAKATVSGLVAADYTEATWKKVPEALAMPETDQTAIGLKVTAINNARTGLVFLGQQAYIDAIKALKAITGNNDNNDYTKESWTAFTAARTKVLATLAESGKEATNAITVAKTKEMKEALKLLQVGILDKTELQKAVTAAETLKNTAQVSANGKGTDVSVSYKWVTQAQMTEFETVINDAKAELASTNTTQTKVNAVKLALTEKTTAFEAIIATGHQGTLLPTPEGKVRDVKFKDDDPAKGVVSGLITWNEPIVTTNVTGYNIYPSSDGETKAEGEGATALNGDTPIDVGTFKFEVIKDGSGVSLGGVTHFIVVCVNTSGDLTPVEAVKEKYASVKIVDLDAAITAVNVVIAAVPKIGDTFSATGNAVTVKAGDTGYTLAETAGFAWSKAVKADTDWVAGDIPVVTVKLTATGVSSFKGLEKAAIKAAVPEGTAIPTIDMATEGLGISPDGKTLTFTVTFAELVALVDAVAPTISVNLTETAVEYELNATATALDATATVIKEL